MPKVDDIQQLIDDLHKATDKLEILIKEVEEEQEQVCPLCGGSLTSGWYGKRFCHQDMGLCGHAIVYAAPKKGRARYDASFRFYKTTVGEDGNLYDHPKHRQLKRELVIQFTPGEDPLVLSRDHEWLDQPLVIGT